MPITTLPDEHVSVTRAQDRRRRPGLLAHLAAAGTPVVTVRGLRASAPVQTFIELGEQLDLVHLVVVGDRLARTKRCTPAELRDLCAESKHPGARRARRAAAYVRSLVDSAMETRLQMLIVLAGLPEPEVNIDAHGWLHVSVFSRGIYRDPAKTVRRVETALRSRGAILPRQLSDAWRPFFPGH